MKMHVHVYYLLFQCGGKLHPVIDDDKSLVLIVLFCFVLFCFFSVYGFCFSVCFSFLLREKHVQDSIPDFDTFNLFALIVFYYNE